jgi:hypothetical protein
MFFCIEIGCSSVSISRVQEYGDMTGTIVLKDGKKITFEKAFVGVDGKIVRINNETIHQTILMENITSITLGKSKK